MPPGSVRPLRAQTFKVRLMVDSEVGDCASLEGFASLLPNKEILEEEVWRRVLGISRSRGGEWLSFSVRQEILEEGLKMRGALC